MSAIQQMMLGTSGSTAPGPPLSVSAAVTGGTSASVSFSAPTNNGGSAITGYTVTSSPGGGTDTNAGSTSLTHAISGLTQGTTYSFTVTATNAIGTGGASAASNSIVPATAPSAPTIGTATASNGQISVTFTGGYDGGSALFYYTATAAGGSGGSANGTSPIVITGLTNGTAYTVSVTATNAYGTSGSSAASNSATPSTVPDAPTIGTATAGNAQASVTFTAGGNGGSTITGFTVTSSPGSFTGTGASSPIVVSGLTNGTGYTFTVTATNANGTGSASAASNSATPSNPAVTASYSTSLCSGSAVGPSNATTNSVTCIATGGVGPFTYAWTFPVDPTNTTINSSTSATTTFTVTNNAVATYTGTARCTITDTGNGGYSTFFTGYDVDILIDIS